MMRVGEAAGALADGVRALFPPDPGSLRLRQAARATIAATLTLVIVRAVGTAGGLAVPADIFGFAMGLFAAATVHDATPAAQRATILLAIVPASLATALAAYARQIPWLGEACFVAILSGTVYASTRGARPASLGTVGMIAYVIGLVSAVRPEDLPGRVAIAAVAALAALLAQSALLPERPERVLERIGADVRRRVRAILAGLEQAVREGVWRKRARGRMRRAIARLDEAVVVAETVLGGPGGRAQARVLGLEALDLALERVAWKVMRALPAGAGRTAIAAEMEAVRLGERPGDGAAEVGLPAALAALGEALGGKLRVEAPAPVSAPQRAPARRGWHDPGLRRLVQVALATGIAIVLGRVIPGRWYWAAFAAFVVFLGTRSRGESLAKALQFMVGTIAGVLAGALVATALSGHAIAAFVCIIVAVFLAFQASTAAYGVMIFWITIILGLMFGLLGYFPPDLLASRLVETAIGSVSGVMVASLVWATPTGDVIAAAERAYLAALAAVIDCAVRCLTSGKRDPALLSLTLALEGRFVDLAAAARPATLGMLAGARERPRRRAWLVAACHYRARALGRLAGEAGGPAGAGADAALAAAMARIDARIAALAGEPGAASAAPPAPEGEEDARVDAALVLLRRIEALLERLAEG